MSEMKNLNSINLNKSINFAIKSQILNENVVKINSLEPEMNPFIKSNKQTNILIKNEKNNARLKPNTE